MQPIHISNMPHQQITTYFVLFFISDNHHKNSWCATAALAVSFSFSDFFLEPRRKSPSSGRSFLGFALDFFFAPVSSASRFSFQTLRLPSSLPLPFQFPKFSPMPSLETSASFLLYKLQYYFRSISNKPAPFPKPSYSLDFSSTSGMHTSKGRLSSSLAIPARPLCRQHVRGAAGSSTATWRNYQRWWAGYRASIHELCVDPTMCTDLKPLTTWPLMFWFSIMRFFLLCILVIYGSDLFEEISCICRVRILSYFH
jgi:hypothetical protein